MRKREIEKAIADGKKLCVRHKTHWGGTEFHEIIEIEPSKASGEWFAGIRNPPAPHQPGVADSKRYYRSVDIFHAENFKMEVASGL